MLLNTLNWEWFVIFLGHCTVMEINFSILIDVATHVILPKVVLTKPSEYTIPIRDVNIKQKALD